MASILETNKIKSGEIEEEQRQSSISAISIITETFGIIPKISIGPESLDFLHVFRPTF